MIDLTDHPTFSGERARHRKYLFDGQITGDQYREVIELLHSVEHGTFDGDYSDLMAAYRLIIHSGVPLLAMVEDQT